MHCSSQVRSLDQVGTVCLRSPRSVASLRVCCLRVCGLSESLRVCSLVVAVQTPVSAVRHLEIPSRSYHVYNILTQAGESPTLPIYNIYIIHYKEI